MEICHQKSKNFHIPPKGIKLPSYTEEEGNGIYSQKQI